MEVHSRNLQQKSRKRDNSPVVSLLPDFCKRLASRNPHVLCQKHGGACTTYQLGMPRYKKRDEKLDALAAEKGAKKLVSSDLAKILEYESSNKNKRNM